MAMFWLASTSKESVTVNAPVETIPDTEPTAQDGQDVTDAASTAMDAADTPAAEAASADVMGTALPLEDDDGTALAKLRDLVQRRTRFDASEVQGVSEACVAQTLRIQATHALAFQVNTAGITGRTAIPGARVKSTHPETDAVHSGPERLAIGMQRLSETLCEPSTTYNQLRDGLWLAADNVHYELHGCSPCNGRGSVTCHTCSGARTETCYSCSGRGSSTCYSCNMGKVSCPSCYGTCFVTRGETEYYTEQVWVNGQYETYHRSRWVNRQVPCTSCVYGKVTCSHCSGRGELNCITCSTRGTITCRTCGGAGDLRCNPCEGSGRVGTSAWVEVHHKASYAMDWTGALDDRATAIGEAKGLHGVAQEARVLALDNVGRDTALPSSALVASYDGELDIRHLDAACGGDHYAVVAYGVNRQWLELDDIVDDLLLGDLEALRSALVSADTSGGWFRRLDVLLQPLRHVVDSELNTTLVDAILDGQELDESRALVSAEYAEKLRHALLSALKRIYNRVAVGTWWVMPLLCAALAFATWRLNHPYLAMIPAVGAIPLSMGLLRLRAMRVFNSVLGSKDKARKALEHIRKARHHYVAQGLHGVPTLALAALSVFGAVHAYKATPATPIPFLAEPALAQAMAYYRANDFNAAQPLLQSLAAQGKQDAYLPLATVLWEKSKKESAGQATSDRQTALTWAQKALAATPGDAVAQNLAGQLLTLSGQSGENIAKGVALLKQAASKGQGEAMHALGLLYVMGAQVPKDAAQARHWFTQAAHAGRAGDMYNLGLMDWRGEGLAAPNKESARQWWTKAAAGGDTRAKQAMAQGGPGTR